jgi:hypothetical protein
MAAAGTKPGPQTRVAITLRRKISIIKKAQAQLLAVSPQGRLDALRRVGFVQFV